MKKKKVYQSLKNVKGGTFQKVTIETPVATLKGFKDQIVIKHSEMVVRFGIQYSNMGINKNKVTGDLPWGWWVMKNYVIGNISKKTKEFHLYLRMYTTNIKPKTTYYLNGKEVTKQYLIDNKIISNKKSEERSCFDVKFENVVSIGNC